MSSQLLLLHSSDLHSKLRRLETQVERWFVESEKCRKVGEECVREVKKLEEEKQRLHERITVIDKDIHQVTSIKLPLPICLKSVTATIF